MNISQIIIVCLSFSLCFGAEVKKRNYAVIGIKNTEGVSVGEADIIADRLRGDLFNTGKASMMEREQMQQILKEQGFQQSGACTDEACMVEIGQLLGVERLISGSIGKLGSLFLVNLRSIDVQTAKIIAVVSVDIKGGIEDVVKYLPNIAQQLVAEPNAAQAPVAIAAKPEPPAVNDTVSKPPEPQKEAVAEDTTPKKPETIVIDNTRKEKNKNRAGIRISATFFPGEMTMYYWDSSANVFKKPQHQLDNDYFDKLKSDPDYSSVVYSKAHLRLAVDFMIKTGNYLVIHVGPGFMLVKKAFKYNYDYVDTNFREIREKENWNLRVLTPQVSLGLSFVKRFFPLKINAGIFANLNFNIVVFNENYTGTNLLNNLIIYSYDYRDTDFKVTASFGPRVGMEIMAGKHVGFNVDFIYLFNRITTDLDFIKTYDQRWQYRIPGIGIGAGVNFYF